MRIDPVQVAAMMNQADLAPVRRDPARENVTQAKPQFDEPKPAPVTVPAQKQLSVWIDSDMNVIYRFLDMRTGEVLQQVPPEQVLQVMRSITDLLRQSEQKFEITI